MKKHYFFFSLIGSVNRKKKGAYTYPEHFWNVKVSQTKLDLDVVLIEQDCLSIYTIDILKQKSNKKQN